MYDITLHRLYIFKCVVEAGGIRAAAVILGISQPSVSAHVRAIEALVGQPMLDRRPGKSGSLTDAGHILYNYAHDVVVGADNVGALLRDITVGRRGSVSFAATRTLGNSVLGPILAAYYGGSPGVLVSVHTGTLADMTELVLTGAVGFGLVVAPGPIAGLEGELLRTEPIVLLASPSHPLAARERVEPRDLHDEPLFVSLRSSTNYRSSMAALRLIGFSYQRIAMETDDYTMLKSVIAEGCGVAMLPRESAERELERGELVSLPVTFAMPTLELRLAHLARHQFTPSESTLIQIVRDRLGGSTVAATERHRP